MLRERTVFVIGAGASTEIKLPVGAGLREDIVGLVDFHWDESGQRQSGAIDLLQQVRTNSKADLDFEAAGRRIATGIYGRNSIDEFLDWHRDDEAVVQLGKAAIVRALLAHEEAADRSVFRGQGKFMLSVFDERWYGKLFRLLNAGLMRRQADRLFDNATFVIFNYDRAVENFFYCALQAMDVPATEAEAICRREGLFLHPYGQLAPLFGDGAVKFGEPLRSVNPAVLASNIRTFTEVGKDSQSEIEVKSEIQTVMSRSKTVVYLGFAYNETNLRLLTPLEPSEITRVFGTKFDLPDPVSQDLSALLRSLHSLPSVRSDQEHFGNVKCAKFLHDYGDRIARGGS